MLQIVYASRPLDFSAPSLLNILLTARQFNTANNVTGALIYRDDLFLQMLEGDSVILRMIMKRIMKDDRHEEINLLMDRSVPSRTFTSWNMYENGLDPTRWSRAAVRDKLFQEMPQDEVLALFTRISRKPLRAV